MWILWDNLTASIIVATVILLLLVARQRMVEVNIEQTSSLIIRTSVDSFTTWLEEDLSTMGVFVSKESGQTPVEEWVENSYTAYENGDTIMVKYVERLVFNGAGNKIKYQLEDSTRREVNGKSLVTFTFNRYETTTGVFGAHPNGSVNVPISDFSVDFLDRSGAIVPNPAGAADSLINTTRVRFAVVTPFDVSRNTIRELYYGSTLLVSR